MASFENEEKGIFEFAKYKPKFVSKFLYVYILVYPCTGFRFRPTCICTPTVCRLLRKWYALLSQ